jgi:hypothetical protein
MRKITLSTLFLSFLACCSFFSLVSCEEDTLEIVKESISAEELILDDNFIAISETLHNYATFVKSTIEEKGLSPKEMLPQIDAVNKAPIDETTGKRLNEIFQTDINQKLIYNINVISSNMEVLNSKYNDLNEDLLKEALLKDLETRGIASEARSCSWKYYVCVTACASGGLLCVTGCTGSTLGLGAPACAVLCSSIGLYGLVICYDDYCS